MSGVRHILAFRFVSFHFAVFAVSPICDTFHSTGTVYRGFRCNVQQHCIGHGPSSSVSFPIVSFCFVSFRFVSFGVPFFSFRFGVFRFVSFFVVFFRLIYFGFFWFRFASFRDVLFPFVSFPFGSLCLLFRRHVALFTRRHRA